MESFIILAICVFGLYYFSQIQDRIADTMFGDTFDRFERIYNNVCYSCHDAVVVQKFVSGNMPLPFVPSFSYSARVLCYNETGHWFWFDARIQLMKIKQTSITPAACEEAREALKDDPESCKRYFPGNNQQQST
ncbi:hypothetical protein CI610_00594 [invertebrate metagenome]|uniref:Uncharacterized protein n=1 Tax=invertebrate metagenome TaxID=1711999 RepID=A0A2H9TAZ7_9ZZZZ